MNKVSCTTFSGGFSSVAPAELCPFCCTSMRASCVHTAVIRRNEMQHDSRSMNGTRFNEASSGFLPPLPVGVGAAPPMLRRLHRVAMTDHHVDDLDRNLVDVIEDRLRPAVEDRERQQRGDGGDETERGAVHGLRDALGEQ